MVLKDLCEISGGDDDWWFDEVFGMLDVRVRAFG
jgi:hypothetical protein